ncbi:exosome complex component RRP43 [Pseudohyphozyma bogoriensis]|nr:exosome complex component RRP43 [Pseudohyphozyma bogoriensis]
MTTTSAQPIAGPSTAPSSSLTPALFRRLHPRPYLEKFLAEGVRPDGRPVGASAKEGVWRDASVNLGSISTAPASALVRLGNTTVVCGITLEIAPPDITFPNQGFLVPNVDLPPLCSPLFKQGAPADESQVLATRLRDVLLASTVLPLSSLLIEPSKAAFVVYLDIVCLNYDGGVLDAAVLACVGALRQLVLPEATWDPDTLSTVCHPISSQHPGKPITLGPLPICVSFGIFNSHLLPDTTLFESDLCTSLVSVALSSASKGPLFNIYQAGAPLSSAGGEAGGREQLKACIALARGRARELKAMLEE